MKPPSKQTAYAVKYAKFHRSGYRLTVSPLGARRRVEALHAIGYSHTDLIEATGFSKSWFVGLLTGETTRIQRKRDDKIRALYAALCVRPKYTEAAAKARTHARKQGWAPPMAWDHIDNPTETPQGVEWITTCQVRVNRNRYHPEGRACGVGGGLRKGKCHKHYEQERRAA